MQMGARTHLRGQNTSEIPLRSKRRSHTRKEERVNESFEHSTDDEVVKYMSKLPGYLQGEESNDVLNVGVLDWGRLEKWKKHGRATVRPSKRESKVVSSTTTFGTVVPNASSSHQYQCHRCKIDDQVHASSLLGKVKATSRGLQHSSHTLPCTLDPEFIASRDSLLFNQEIATCSFNNKSSRKGRGYTKSGLFPEMGNSGGSLAAKEYEKRARERGNQCANSNLDGEENHQVSNIVLLRSRKQSSGEPSHKSSLDDNVKVTEVSSLGVTSQVPLSFDLERDSEAMMLPLGGTTRHSKTASRIFDQEKKRNTSPSKRFSFSFGRLSRSFTFKEDSSSAPQPLPSSSTDDTINKSDSMRCDAASACPSQSGNHPEEKHCGSSRVSPLRRLLDHPLLKSKGSENVLPSKARSTSSNLKPTIIDVPLQDEKKKQDRSRTQALFQLTTRNGIPLFQFVVDDDNLNNSRRSILGATMKNSAASSFKDDTVQYCTFYSVNEVKKKRRGGSWLIHGHKEKQQQQRGFVYNVIGQMRLCNSDITEEQKSEKVSSIIREAVLLDETEQVKEVAAVVIKKKHAGENGETTVIIPGGVHSIPEKGAPTPLVSRWRSGGLCDCGGWDVGCKLFVYLSNKTTLLHELDHHQSFKLFAQEESDQDSRGPVLAMTELKSGIYRVEFDSFLSHLQAFFVCVTVVSCASEEEKVSKTTGKSSSPFAPPLSPVGRV
ncbi:unnamed protein product [Eruca vesicaria subsp. sativa]|uniref:DUF3527 domain protein n=1 Tax=Eruca vesicaria subsp. sativa TaxID=29727 RepID=A0ABC8KAZ1_ERUVS|nr:unnamed protein product [Eruca vesicaria subsp. sativa]